MGEDSLVSIVPGDVDVDEGERGKHEGVGGKPGKLWDPLIDGEGDPLGEAEGS